jgi:hypothetical protein
MPMRWGRWSVSREAMEEILNRSLLDEDFRAALQDNPESVLESFDLSDDERAALVSGKFDDVAVFMPLHCTIRFAMITKNIIAMKPHPEESRRAEFERRGAEIVQQEGDRIAVLKDFLAMIR